MNDESYEQYVKMLSPESPDWVVKQLAEALTTRDENIKYLMKELFVYEQNNAELRMALQDRIAEVEKLKQLATTFSVIATKHCPKDHHDWQRVLELTEIL